MFKQIENKYRPIPFWSWNEKLNTEETKRQIMLMDEAGIGGFFMHARGGLRTEYMGEEWFENVSVGVEEGKRRKMYAWAYDENGWPSGFGNGLINGLGLEYQQKYLRFEEGEKTTDTTICNKDGIHFYYEVNPFYVDTLNDAVAKKFIKQIYEPYYQKYKNEIEGFFTDEPQISRNGIPWSFLLPDAYKAAYGENLLDHLLELFRPVGDYPQTRLKFWKLVCEMFSKNFLKQIYDWCEEHNLKLTGHCTLEEKLRSQITPNGACMPHYEYFHIPGMDWLERPIFRCLTPLQVSSVAHQLGKERSISETFAMCGHNIGHNELKGIFEWQMVNGITQLCQHLQGYSMRGIRKRDYPPAMSYQQPWWGEYKVFNDSMSRIGKILSTGEVKYDTLLIHPQSSAWVCFDNDKNEGLKELDEALVETMRILEEKHILYHFGDEIIMERHAKVDGATLVIGTQRYKTVVMPKHNILFENTKKLLDEFRKNGGKVIEAKDAENNTVIDVPEISYTKRSFENFDVHYFVNSTDKAYAASIAVGSKKMDITNGELVPFDGKHTFAPFGSLVVVDDGTERIEAAIPETELKLLDLSGEWKIKSATANSITLDKCDYYFDGEPVEKDGYVLNIQGRACELLRPVNIRCEYKLNVGYSPKKLYLVCETPEIFDIFVNGEKIEKSVEGYFVDFSFKKIDIAKYIKEGKNIITFEVLFKQTDKVYENIVKAKIFESERNKLTYDMEIEPIYIVGDFSVQCDGSFETLKRNACRYTGEFTLMPKAEGITISNIEQQGYPFFAGSITLEKEFDLEDTDYKIDFIKKGVNAVRIEVNDTFEKVLMWEPFATDISNYLEAGKNKVKITLTNNLRNLLGPHHIKDGESYSVGPWCFYKELCAFSGGMPWDWGYCLAEFGIQN